MTSSRIALAAAITVGLCVTIHAQVEQTASPTTEPATQPSGSSVASQELTKDWNKLERAYELLNRLDRGTANSVTRDTLTVGVRRDNGQTTSKKYRVDENTKILIAQPGEPDPGRQVTVANMLKLRFEYGKLATIDRGSRVTVAWDEPDRAAFIQATPSKYNNKSIALVGTAPLEPTPLPAPSTQPGRRTTTTSWSELENAYERVGRVGHGKVTAVEGDVVTVTTAQFQQVPSTTRKYHVDAQTRIVAAFPDPGAPKKNERGSPSFVDRYAKPSDLVPGMPVTVGWDEPDRAVYIKAMPASPGGFSIRGELPPLKSTPLPAPSTQPATPP